MDLNLKGKNAIVCGSTQGIGKAAAVELASLGANITLVARDEKKLKETLKELPVSGSQSHTYLAADFTDPETLRKKLAAYIQNMVFHILINNTGGPAGGPILEAKIEEFTNTFSQHLVCNHILVQAVVPGMKKDKYGRIINVISTSVKQPLRGLGVSNTVRAAVANWSKTLSMELAPYGITVNNVLPGMTDTGRISQLLSAKAERSGTSVGELKKEMLAEIPMGRMALPSETASAIAFLASPAAAYITGINIPVDGGRTGSL